MVVQLYLQNAGGVNEYAIPNQNCLMYEPKDRKTLKAHMKTLINKTTLRNKIAKNAENKAKEFDWQKSTEQLLRCLAN